VLQCIGKKAGSKKANEMKALLPFPLVAALIGPAQAQSETRENPNSTTRTMASLLAEGYEPQTVQLFKDKIWMRKDIAGGLAFICDRGRIGSPAFEAYREKKYDQISCTLAP
jgi:hypothetical protein